MVSNEEVLRRVAKVLQTVLFADPAKISRTTVAADLNGWDSVAHSTIILYLEDEFGLELPLDQTGGLEDVGALADLVAAELAAKDGWEAQK